MQRQIDIDERFEEKVGRKDKSLLILFLNCVFNQSFDHDQEECYSNESTNRRIIERFPAKQYHC